MSRQVFARPFIHPSYLSVILLVGLLLLSGCGRTREPEAEVLPTATQIATLAPFPTLVPTATVATPEVAAAEESTGESTGETTGEVTVEITTTEQITATAGMTAPAETTASEEVTGTAAVTPSTEITASAEVTAGEEVSGTDEVVASEEVTATVALTESEHTDAGHVMTGTAEISSPAEVTATTEISALSDLRATFLQPTTNAVVPITFTVVISRSDGMAPAGADEPEAAHLYLLIDSDFVEAGEPIVDDDFHRHVDQGFNSSEVSLAAGSRILRLQYADSNYQALAGNQYRDEIIVSVVEGAPQESIRFVSPTSGATVPPIFTVVMAAAGLSIEPAGVVTEDGGHFHLLIDEPFVAPDEIIPVDDTHFHFGKGQLTSTVTLEPGVYDLRLQYANGAHRALAGEQYRAEATVIVEEDAPDEQVMFVKPADGATVTSPFLVGWAANGLIIEAAGRSIRPEAGHMHLLIGEEFVAPGEVIPMDETHLHFGKGQTSVELTLEPGQYIVRLQMADGAHIAKVGPQYQDEITVTVR